MVTDPKTDQNSYDWLQLSQVFAVVQNCTSSTPEIEVVVNSKWYSFQTESDFKTQFKHFGSNTHSFKRRNHISKFAQPLSPWWNWVIDNNCHNFFKLSEYVIIISQNCHYWTNNIHNWSQLVSIGQNCHNLSQFSQLVKIVTIGHNYHNWSKLSQLVKIVTIGQNCLKLSQLVTFHYWSALSHKYLKCIGNWVKHPNIKFGQV